MMFEAVESNQTITVKFHIIQHFFGARRIHFWIRILIENFYFTFVHIEICLKFEWNPPTPIIDQLNECVSIQWKEKCLKLTSTEVLLCNRSLDLWCLGHNGSTLLKKSTFCPQTQTATNIYVWHLCLPAYLHAFSLHFDSQKSPLHMNYLN